MHKKNQGLSIAAEEIPAALFHAITLAGFRSIDGFAAEISRREKVEITGQTVRYWIAGRSTPTLDKWEAALRVLAARGVTNAGLRSAIKEAQTNAVPA